MENYMQEIFITVFLVGFAAVFGLKSYAESRLHWRHPLNLFLNGDPSDSRQTTTTYGGEDTGIGDSCGGD